MNLQELKNKARTDFKQWLTDEYDRDDIVGTEPDDWDEAIRDFSGQSATHYDPNVILEEPKLNEIDIDFDWYDTIGGMIYDNVHKFLDRYLYDEFDEIVNEITE